MLTDTQAQKWLHIAQNIAQTLSTCNKKQYAAIILNQHKRVISIGYNGSPPGHPHCTNGHCPRYWENTPNGQNYDNCIANHAETNALLWADPAQLHNATLIINGPPCYTCTKLICTSGITQLIHHPDPTYQQWPQCQQTLQTSGITITTIPHPTTTPTTTTYNPNPKNQR
jgi:dCMP deaminase